MAGDSKIEWTDATWNPIVGCSIVSPGCTNCYAMKMAARIEAMSENVRYTAREHSTHYAGTTQPSKSGAVWTGKVALAPEHILTQPLHWKKPRRVFVNSMGDLFHEDIPVEWIDNVVAIMGLASWHVFQILTKRADRMRAYFGSDETMGRVLAITNGWLRSEGKITLQHKGDGLPGFFLPNVWLGVSTERQQEADERIPLLLQTPAAVRFISAEPLLGRVDLKRWMPSGKWGTFKGEPVYHQTYFMTKCEHCGWHGSSELCHESHNVDDADVVCPACNQIFLCDDFGGDLSWVIVGGESGPNARPMDPKWARALRDQCAEANVPFFFKQWGEFAPLDSFSDAKPDAHVYRIGKKKAGRTLDSKEHNAFPQAKEIAFA